MLSDTLPYIAKTWNGLTEDQMDFANWVETYDYGFKKGYCGGKLHEETEKTKDGQRRHRTVMKNTCEHATLVYTLFMDAEEWERVPFFYKSFDSEGRLEHDTESIMTPVCAVSERSASVLGCSFELGFVENFEE